MKSQALWQVSASTTAEAEEPVAALVEQVFGATPTTYTDADTGVVRVSAYLTREDAWTPARKAALVFGLRTLERTGLKIGSGKVLFSKLPRQDWAESWKHHFKPINVSSALLIKPSWSKQRPRKNQKLIVLDPGLSFGTGNHPTTLFCLRQIVAARPARGPRSFLDIGTGSGILSIAAAKLGFHPVEAFDCDPDSVRIARENAKLNRVAGEIRLRQADLTRLPVTSRRKYDLICANLLANLLMQEQARILNRLAPDGTLVIAGILKKEFARVRRTYEPAGLKMIASNSAGEWESGAFIFRPTDR